jgi:hypothetical protein
MFEDVGSYRSTFYACTRLQMHMLLFNPVYETNKVSNLVLDQSFAHGVHSAQKSFKPIF